jgi:hypothetical protein
MSTKLATITTEADQKRLGRQIEDQYEKATTGLVENIALGGLLEQVHKVLSTCGHNSRRGPQTKGDGLKGWLAEHAPAVQRAAAYRCLDLAESIRAEFKIGVKTDLYELLKSAAPSPKEKTLREKIGAFVAGKSQRQLLIGIGRPDAQAGGHRPRQGPAPTEAEIRDAWLEDARNRSVSVFSGLHELDERWKTMPDNQLALAIEDARRFAREAEAWLKTPQPARKAIAVEKHLQAAETAGEGAGS